MIVRAWFGIDIDKAIEDRKRLAEMQAQREAEEEKRKAEDVRLAAVQRAEDRLDTEEALGFPNITKFLGSNASGIDAMTFDSECYNNPDADERCDKWLNEKAKIQSAKEEADRIAEEKKRADIVAQIENKVSNLTANKALMVVITDGDWSGGIRNSGADYYSVSGHGFDMIEFECGDFGSYGVSAQKKSDNYGPLHLSVVKGDKILDQGNTNTEYGIVALNGNC
jgi:hypothetical protein